MEMITTMKVTLRKNGEKSVNIDKKIDFSALF